MVGCDASFACDTVAASSPLAPPPPQMLPSVSGKAGNDCHTLSAPPPPPPSALPHKLPMLGVDVRVDRTVAVLSLAKPNNAATGVGCAAGGIVVDCGIVGSPESSRKRAWSAAAAALEPTGVSLTSMSVSASGSAANAFFKLSTSSSCCSSITRSTHDLNEVCAAGSRNVPRCYVARWS